MFPAGRPDITQRFVALESDVRLRIAESGPRDGPAVVMLPGWGASVYMYRHGFPLLAARGFRVIGVDLRGFGLSDKPAQRGAYSLDAYLADVDALVATLGVDRLSLVGQSMGGGLALHYALRNPARLNRLVLINPTGLIPLPFLPVLRAPPRALFANRYSRHLAPRPLIRFILQRMAYGDPELVTERDIDEYWAPTQQPGFLLAARSALGEFDWRAVSDADAGSLAVPAMVILGTMDRLVPNHRAGAGRLRGAEVHELPGGHCVHEEQPADAYGLIARFLASGSVASGSATR